MQNFYKLLNKNLVALVFVGLLGAFFPNLGVAQEQTLAPADCFDFYQFQSVMVDITPTFGETVSGSQMRFNLTATNQNDYPIVDGSIYIKIFQKQTDQKNVSANANFLVDQFFVKEGLVLDAKETKKFDFTWNVPAWAPEGNYLAFSYFESAKKFNLLGLTFTDDITGGRADFKIKSDIKASVMLDRNNVKANGKAFRLVGPSQRFTKDETITIEVPVKNPTKQAQEAEVTFALYTWDALNERIDFKTEKVSLKANETKKLTYEIKDARYPVYYLVASSSWHDFNSIAGIRVARAGIDKARINSMGVLKFPIKQGEANTLFTCAHTMGTITKEDAGENLGESLPINSKIEVSLMDKNGGLIQKSAFTGEINSEVMGFKTDFTPAKSYSNFQIKTVVYDAENKVMDEATLKYSCDEINKEKCIAEAGPITPPPPGENKPIYIYIGIGILALGLVLGVFFGIRKRRNHLLAEEEPTPLGNGSDFPINKNSAGMMLWLLLIGAMTMFLLNQTAEAKSVIYNYVYSSPVAPGVPVDRNLYLGNKKALANPSYIITYNAQAHLKNGSQLVPLNDGDKIRRGSEIVFSYDPNDFKLTGSITAFWTGTGGIYDTPYGHWKSGATYPYTQLNTCSNDDLLFATDYYAHYRPLSVAPPVITFETNAALGNCTNTPTTKTCRVMTDTGTIEAKVKFALTSGSHYASIKNIDGNRDFWDVPVGACEYKGLLQNKNREDFKLNIPEQSISFQFTARPATGVPAGTYLDAPNIIGPTSGVIGTQYTFMAHASSSGVTSITYEIDWDNNGTVDGNQVELPQDSASFQKSWALAGTYTFKVRASDLDSGIVTEWRPHTINIGQTATCEQSEYWTACSATCGGGTRNKIRVTNACAVEIIETKACNLQPCGNIIIEVPPGGP